MCMQVYIYVVLCMFSIVVYITSKDLGSPAVVYANLTVSSPSPPLHPGVSDEGSVMAMRNA